MYQCQFPGFVLYYTYIRCNCCEQLGPLFLFLLSLLIPVNLQLFQNKSQKIFFTSCLGIGLFLVILSAAHWGLLITFTIWESKLHESLELVFHTQWSLLIPRVCQFGKGVLPQHMLLPSIIKLLNWTHLVRIWHFTVICQKIYH